MTTTVRYIYPRTELPPELESEIAQYFIDHESDIGTDLLDDGLKSDEVLREIRPDLVEMGFDVEKVKRQNQKIKHPVLFGEDTELDLQYFVDGFHSKWKCGIEVEAGRALKGNASYRDLIQALVMVQVDTFVLAVPNVNKYNAGDRRSVNPAYDKTKNVAETLDAAERFDPPYRLVLIGY